MFGPSSSGDEAVVEPLVPTEALAGKGVNLLELLCRSLEEVIDYLRAQNEPRSRPTSQSELQSPGELEKFGWRQDQPRALKLQKT